MRLPRSNLKTVLDWTHVNRRRGSFGLFRGANELVEPFGSVSNRCLDLLEEDLIDQDQLTTKHVQGAAPSEYAVMLSGLFARPASLPAQNVWGLIPPLPERLLEVLQRIWRTR
jgi:hypothetical protein